MSETLEPALPDQLDRRAERLMRRLCPVRVQSLRAMLEMLHKAL